jgi:hypothetical protein
MENTSFLPRSINVGGSANVRKKKITKVLLALANPVDYPGLSLDDEERSIRKVWRLGEERDTIEIKTLLATTGNDLRYALQEKADIVHIAGHGAGHYSER